MSEAKVTNNIYQKLQKVRRELSGLNLKKSGKNSHNNYSYYELGDFLPSVTKLCDENKLLPLFLLEDKKAKLWIIDTESPDSKILFFIPVADAKVPGGQDIQNLGAKITYLERYTYMIAFEIAESDAVESSKPDDSKEIDQIAIDKINKATTAKELVDVSKELKKELGQDFHKSLVTHYTRRKKEIENEAKTDENS